MKNTALLIVDVQRALIDNHPFHEAELLRNIERLLATARKNHIEVIYVRHDGGVGDELEPHTEGWKIARPVTPQAAEKIFDKKFNSAFKGTGLREYLSEKHIGTVVLMGMQTEYCIDTTCKVAFEYGFSVLIPEGTTATYDNDFFQEPTSPNTMNRKSGTNVLQTLFPWIKSSGKWRRETWNRFFSEKTRASHLWSARFVPVFWPASLSDRTMLFRRLEKSGRNGRKPRDCYFSAGCQKKLICSNSGAFFRSKAVSVERKSARRSSRKGDGAEGARRISSSCALVMPT